MALRAEFEHHSRLLERLQTTVHVEETLNVLKSEPKKTVLAIASMVLDKAPLSSDATKEILHFVLSNTLPYSSISETYEGKNLISGSITECANEVEVVTTIDELRDRRDSDKALITALLPEMLRYHQQLVIHNALRQIETLPTIEYEDFVGTICQTTRLLKGNPADPDDAVDLCYDLLKLDTNARSRYINRLKDNEKHALINRLTTLASSRDNLNGVISAMLSNEDKARIDQEAMQRT